MANKNGRTSLLSCQAFLMEKLCARRGRAQVGAGLKAHNMYKKKYPLIISDERVSLRHLNLMTLPHAAVFLCLYKISPKA